MSKQWITLLIALAGSFSFLAAGAHARDIWTAEQATLWYAGQPWMVGCNFAPSTAINQLEMWQAGTFDPETIDRELGYAQGIGFNAVRVFLHHLPWEQDRDAFLRRIERFLEIADRHRIAVIFVPFDGVWDPQPHPGEQPKPRPHVHNSGWVQSPGAALLRNPARHDEFRPYVEGLIKHFRNDRRVWAWDLFNEPDNPNTESYGAKGAKTELSNKAEMANLLLEKVFVWARSVDPTQPLTAGVWMGPWPDHKKLSAIETLMLEQSDVISFHNYGDLSHVRLRVDQLRRYGRPILCTEFMARPVGSRFDPLLEYFREQKVAAFNWGFVAGKTQTQYPWDSWHKRYMAEPEVWFHEIFRRDGTPYDPKEVDYIKRVTGAK